MKTILSVVLLTMLGITTTLAQTDDNLPHAILCSAQNPGDTLTYAELIECNELTQPFKEIQVQSFKVCFKIPEGNGGLFYEYSNFGSKLNPEIKEIIKTLKSQGVKKLLIESVVVLTPNGDTRKMRGININLI